MTHDTNLVAEAALGGLGVGVQHEGVRDFDPCSHLHVHPGGSSCTCIFSIPHLTLPYRTIPGIPYHTIPYHTIPPKQVFLYMHMYT